MFQLGKITLALIMLGSSTVVLANAIQPVQRLETIEVIATDNTDSSHISNQMIDGQKLKQKSSTLGEALGEELGIHGNSFGGGSSAPVIRGQEGKRIRILNSGSETLDMSAMSPDHAITSDSILADKIEIMRGANTLLYSSGNSAGVVNVVDGKIPTQVPARPIGELGMRINTANQERLSHLAVTTNLGKNVAIHAEGLYKKANDYKTPTFDYQGEPHHRLDNSFSNSQSGSLGVSWIGENGFLGVAYQQRKDVYGLPAHSHLYDGYQAHVIIDTMFKPYLKYYPFLMGEADVDYNNPGIECAKKSYHSHSHLCEYNHSHSHNDEHDHEHSDNPNIFLKTKRWDMRGEWRNPIVGLDKINVNFSHADYFHDERTDSVVDNAFKNRGYNARLELVHAPIGRLSGLVGIQHLHQSTQALDKHTLPYYRQDLLHDHTSTQNSLFLLEQLDLDAVKIDFATRVEHQTIKMKYNLDVPEGEEPPAHLTKPYKNTAYSYAVSTNWQVNPQNKLNFTVSHQERLPNSQELYAHGKHIATNSFEIGNKDLNKERSLNFELSWLFKGEKFDALMSGYYNNFDNYIYLNTLNDGHCYWKPNNKCSRSLDDEYSLRLNRYNQSKAKIYGIEAKFGYQFSPAFYASVWGDYVRGKLSHLQMIPTGYRFEYDINGDISGVIPNGWRTQPDGNAPRMPAGRLGVQAMANFNDYFSGDVQLYHVFNQNKVAYLERPTKGHTMLNIGLNYRQNWANVDYEIFLKANNLLNDKVYQHTSSLSYIPQMGRNFALGFNLKF